MKDFNSINEILDFAIQNEQNAIDFYTELASSARSDDMRQIFEEFAREEIGHKARLAKIKNEGVFDLAEGKVLDLKISDYTVRSEPKENMSYEETLILAMKREKAAFRLYTKLSEQAPSADLKKIFASLALEESRHKLRFEVEYD
ncbi:MAG: ferritin family protein, partial [Bacteroidetes bacterium]|nr:ferritin family protein [Bacteroidota bacterium]